MPRHIPDKRIVGLIAEVIGSFSSNPFRTRRVLNGFEEPKGLPLGNLTSQLLVNVYMNEFDQFVKNQLKATYYIRYADDFVILSPSRRRLDGLLVSVEHFLRLRFNLNLHPDKVSIATFSSGIDFLGWVHFPDHRVLRSATKRRMFRNLDNDASDARVASYRGMLSHGNAHALAAKLPR